MIRKALLVISLAASWFGTGFAQSKPDMNGTWKLNVSKSDFGILPAPESRTDVIEYADPEFKITTNVSAANGKQSYTARFTTDGKEGTSTIGQRELKYTAGWEGNALVVNTKTTFNGQDVTIKSVWTLSDDGKTLTQSAHFTTPVGETDQKSVFEKQEAGEAAKAAPAAVPAAVPAAASDGPKPNFSGVWKLDVAKSEFGPLPGPDSRTETIEHNDTVVTITVNESGSQGPREFSVKLATDGKETVSTVQGYEVKSVSHWEGRSLVTKSKLKVQENDIDVQNTLSLSDDGRVLTVSAHLASAMGEGDQKFIYDKQ
jgi:hypothetical protein